MEMEAQRQEVAALLRKIAGLLAAIDNLPSLSPSPARVAFVGSGPMPLVLAARHMPPRVHFEDSYDGCGAASDRARRPVRAAAAARVSFRTADVSDLEARDLAAYDVVFLAAAAAVGGAGTTAAGKAEAAVAHLGRHMAAGAALVVDVEVEPEVVARAGFDVLAVCHPDGDAVTNSVIVARKAADGPRRNGKPAAPHVVSSPSGSCTAEASAWPSGGKGGARKRLPRSCRLDAIIGTRRRAW